jgi:WD40 repeat protein
MSWNAENTDLLAVGYGKIDFLQDNVSKSYLTDGKSNEDAINGGLVLFWSLRNPDYPQKVLTTSHPVTALDFSKKNPTLLAVGLYNGDIMVYNVRRDDGWEKPVESSSAMAGGHSEPVW